MNAPILVGDCRGSLRSLDAGSVQCVVTSPPYFGLRDYKTAPLDWPAVEYAPLPGLPVVQVPPVQCGLGAEADPAAYVGHMVDVFRDVWRVLRDDGTIWLNLGDTYASTSTYNAPRTSGGEFGRVSGPRQPNAGIPEGLKAKDLMGVPWRVALALQADGWYLRSDVVWAKPNPMPESVSDRPTRSHEFVFLLSKSERYYYDQDAIREPHAEARATKAGASAMRGQASQRPRGGADSPDRYFHPAGRNKRSVWTVAVQPYAGAHFATFPPALIEPCIRAGSRPGDTVLDPFGGSGTTAAVAITHGRRTVLCELNPEYADLARERLGLFGRTA